MKFLVIFIISFVIANFANASVSDKLNNEVIELVKKSWSKFYNVEPIIEYYNDVDIKDENTKYEIKILKDNIEVKEKISGNVLIELETKDENKNVKKLTIKAFVDMFIEVISTKRKINIKQNFTAENLQIDKKKLSSLSGGYIPYTELDKLITGGFIARSAVQREVHLLPNQIEKVFDIKFGDQVSLILKNGNVIIRTKALSQGMAYVGDDIKVKTIEKKKIVTGKLVSKGEVEVSI